jgi:hypothetical protein
MKLSYIWICVGVTNRDRTTLTKSKKNPQFNTLVVQEIVRSIVWIIKPGSVCVGCL